MANVDLVDLVPILKAINSIKNEYKEALQTSETDFSLYPVLTENFLDKAYNDGYEVGFKQAWMDYLGTEDVEVILPREMRELVPATYTSQSGDATYDTLTSIMNFCLSVRRNLKTILDLDTDLFELYPPRLLEEAAKQYIAGTNDGYVQGYTQITNLDITPPIIDYVNNVATIRTTFPGATTYYRVGVVGEFMPYVDGTEIPVPEDSTIVVYAYSNASTKNSEVVSRECTYTGFLQPTITFEDNIAMIYSNYLPSENIKVMYKVSTWEGYQNFIEYDGIPIPISMPVTVEAYNLFEDGSTSDTTSLACIPSVNPNIEKPRTPVLSFSDSNNILTITCSTPGATIFYMKEGSTLGWIQYTAPMKLVESGTYYAISMLDGVESDISDACQCNVASSGGTGIILAPVMICNDNKVTVFTSQTGVTLKVIRLDYGYVDSANDIPFDSWVTYDGPFDISKDGRYQAKAILNSDPTKEALSVPIKAEYTAIQPGNGATSGGGEGSSTTPYISAPLIHYTNHVVSMTCPTPDVTIMYNTYYDTTWREYTTPITIEESTTFRAKAIKDGYESAVTELACKVEDEGVWMCYMEFSYDTLTVTTNVTGGTIMIKRANDTWEEYSGPINIIRSDWWYSKVVKNDFESSVFALWCEYSNTDYHDLYFTVVLEEDGFVSMHTNIGSSSSGQYFGYLNGLGRWSSFPLNHPLYWRANEPLLISSGLRPDQVVIPNKRDIWLSTYETIDCTGWGEIDFTVYGNAASLFSGFEDGNTIPDGVHLHIGAECENHNGLIWYPEKDWELIVQHREAPSTPNIAFNENNNSVSISTSLDGSIKYKINDGEWLDYIYPFVISSNCTVYAKAYNTGRYSTNWSEEASLECEIDEEVPIIEDCKISEPELGIVNIICSTPDVDIYYKLKNEEDWTKYTGTLHLDSPDELTVRPQLDFNGTTIYGNTIIKPVCDPSSVPYVYASCYSNIVTIIRYSPYTYYYKKTTDSDWTETFSDDATRFNISESSTYQIKIVNPNSHIENEIELNCVYEEEDYYNQPFTIELTESNSYIEFDYQVNECELYYKVNNGSWTQYIDTSFINPPTFKMYFNNGDKVSFKGVDNRNFSTSIELVYNPIEVYDIVNENKVKKKFKAFGNLKSINYSINNESYTSYGTNYRDLFKDSYITDASNLYFNARSAYSLNFNSAFKNCIYLTKAPNLGGLYNYTNRQGYTTSKFKSNNCTEMFSGCTSLTTTPKLFDIRCSFEKMFENCTSLTTISNLPMFIGDDNTSSNTYSCSHMFSGCTSLINTPLLIYIDVNQYGVDSFDLNYMFEGCTSLTRTLHLVWRGVGTNTGTIGFTSIFSNCSNINYIKQLQYIIGRYAAHSWVSGVSATGTFVKKSGVTWEWGIPTGWTVVEV